MDRLFAGLLLGQWLVGIILALVVSPRTWTGAVSQTHVHVWAAIWLGGAIAAAPIYCVIRFPGRLATRHIVAIGQMLASALLIHLTGGRIETHFHVFGSLAVLACYRDCRVLCTATIVVVLDHYLRGVVWPESVYGVATTSSWRFVEHAGWVVFEVLFLGVTIRQSQSEMEAIAIQTTQLESTNAIVEGEVRRRTSELQAAKEATELSNRKLEKVIASLEEKNRELDEFTYVASHDLQEPVRKLVSFSKLLAEDIGTDLNEDAERDLNFIVDAAKRMRDLVQDLLALSRTGRAAMKKEEVSLDECVDMALDNLQIRIEECGAIIHRDELPTVFADRSMLVQLYQNLIGNSLKFIDENTTPEIMILAERQGNLWVLGVKDNGIGLKAESADRIFKPFQRLHKRSEFTGTGIGLAICKKTVQRHGGTITVESTPGQGAHFIFTLVAMNSGEQSCEMYETSAKQSQFC